jgi:hypothetical protein
MEVYGDVLGPQASSTYPIALSIEKTFRLVQKL